MGDHEKDLPLMANSQDILVTHYLLYLSCDFGRKIFSGEMFISLLPVSTCLNIDKTNQKLQNQPFSFILDSKDIEIREVHQVCVDDVVEFTRCATNCVVNDEIDLSDRAKPSSTNFSLDMNSADHLRRMPTTELKFSVEPWCIRIWKDGVTDPGLFPEVLVMKFQTTAGGASIKWSKDQDNRDCCFTHGAWINNRSLFPCQEPPDAMATWQAFVTVPCDAVVIMSGDCEPFVTPADGLSTELKTFYYYTHMKLPMATLALAIGYWEIVSLNKPVSPWVHNLDYADEYCYTRDGVAAENVVCRIVATKSLLSKAVKEFGEYVPKCVKAATNWLGPYPFRRLDLLFMPRCFDCLGMASPNVTFVSQSMLCGDGSMSVHLAHELAHAWFGLLIGASDWTEEWLSEGFATFMEDVIHQSCVTDMSVDQSKDWRQVRNYMRYKTLCSELENTDESLQTLRPNKEIEKSDLDSSVVYVKNGMNDDKMFTQVHYLKGYFMLEYLSNLVGFLPFMDLLSEFVRKYHGQLVHSKEVLQIFLDAFPGVCDDALTIDSLYEKWLDFPGVPPMLQDREPPPSNKLYSKVLDLVTFWKNVNKLCMQHRSHKKLKFDMDQAKQELSMEQTILLLEQLLKASRLCGKMLQKLREHYVLQHKNANIRHRWCELVIKHNYANGLNDVKTFLIEDQAMGVYLYGELMVSEKFRLQLLARNCWNIVKNELSFSAANVVREMVE